MKDNANNSMESIDSSLQFKKYQVNTLQFKIEDIDREGIDEFPVTPRFLRQIYNIDKDNIEVVLGCKIDSTPEEPFPFSCEVVISGFFHIKEDCDNREVLIQENAFAILFPYLRSTLSSLTLIANKEPLILPTLNIVKLLELLSSGESEDELDSKS